MQPELEHGQELPPHSAAPQEEECTRPEQTRGGGAEFAAGIMIGCAFGDGDLPPVLPRRTCAGKEQSKAQE